MAKSQSVTLARDTSRRSATLARDTAHQSATLARDTAQQSATPRHITRVLITPQVPQTATSRLLRGTPRETISSQVI